MYRHRVRHQENEQEPLDRWLVSYADYVTLMFALFVVLYSIAIHKEEEYKTISETLAQVFEKPVDKQTGVVGDAVLTDNQPRSDYQQFGASLEVPSGPEVVADAKEQPVLEKPQFGNPLVSLQQQLTQSLANLIEKGVAKVESDEEWLTIQLNSGLLFPSGSGSPIATADIVLKEIVTLLNQTNNIIRVRGYTDNEAIHNEIFDSNWELSMARAMAVLRRLQALGVNPERMAAEGYGEYSPFADNSTAEGRTENRKVVIAVSKLSAQVPQSAAELPVKNVATEPNNTEVSVEQTPASAAEDVEVSADGTIKVIRLPHGGIKITSAGDKTAPVQQKRDN
ncbi:MAG: flagellar motor protein [Rheinheimera sp.]|nr:MAG: flagellar motor protein [Rheinheimera sp.]